MTGARTQSGNRDIGRDIGRRATGGWNEVRAQVRGRRVKQDAPVGDGLSLKGFCAPDKSGPADVGQCFDVFAPTQSLGDFNDLSFPVPKHQQVRPGVQENRAPDFSDQ